MVLPRLHFSTLFQTKCFSWTAVLLLKGFLLGIFFVVAVVGEQMQMKTEEMASLEE